MKKIVNQRFVEKPKVKDEIINGYKESFIDSEEMLCERKSFWFENPYDEG